MKKLLLLALLPAFCTAVKADDLNQRIRLAPDIQLKINKVIAKSYIQKQTIQSQTNNIQSNNNPASNSNGGAQMNLNNISNVRQAPKEVITVVPHGDIVNVCFHC